MAADRDRVPAGPLVPAVGAPGGRLRRPAEALTADTPLFTESGVAVDVQPAGIASRAAALIIDLVALYALTTVLVIGGAALGSVAGAVVIAIVGGLALVGYPLAFETLWDGRTPGKAALGLRVVSAQGGPIGFRAAGVRAALLLVDVATFGFSWAIGVLCSPRGRRLGDVAASTMVVRDRESAAADLRPVAFLPPEQLVTYRDHLDVGLLDPAGYRLIRAVLLRTRRMNTATANRLVERTGHQVAARLQHPIDLRVSAEQYLLCVASAFQVRHLPPGAPPPQLFTPGAPGSRLHAGPGNSVRSQLR
ncbi:MAG: RDD family protein [Acidimicrobiales bacterium]